MTKETATIIIAITLIIWGYKLLKQARSGIVRRDLDTLPVWRIQSILRDLEQNNNDEFSYAYNYALRSFELKLKEITN